MEFKKRQLDNGLVIIGELNKAAKSAAVGFFVRTGARDENGQINGVSHFLEHMLFKGTEKLSAFEVNEAFDSKGAKFNAYTGEENTVFFASVLPEYLTEISRLWSQLLRPALRDDDFSMEKNVIKQEIAMYKDQPEFDVMDRCRKLYFGEHPCGNSVLGTEESIDKLTAEQMRGYFQSRYAPNNIVLAAVGDFDWDQVCAVVEEVCGRWQRQDVTRALDDFGGSIENGRIAKANLAREHICLMSPGVSAQDDRRFAASLLDSIVGDSVGSRFFWELVDNAIAEEAVMHSGPMDGTGLFYSYIRCSRENVEKVLEIVKKVFSNLRADGITNDELRKAKNKLLSHLVIKNEVPSGRLFDLGLNWIYLKKYRKLSDDIEAIKQVSVADVNSLIGEFNLSDFTQFSIGPGEDGS